MDNLCHTLVGAAIGEAGLKDRSRFGYGALLVAANLPDIDALVFVSGVPSVAVRRGWTHGVLAQALLPLLLVAALVAWDRWRPAAAQGVRTRPGALVLGAYLGVLSHVLLDWMNNYGVRLLMPFSSRWFYGDTLFIIDLWLWLILGFGVYAARRRRDGAFARRALATASLYILVMMVSAASARRIVRTAWIQAHGGPPKTMMVGPLPVTPLSKSVIVDAGNHFETGTFSWLSRDVQWDAETLPNRTDDPAVQAARETPAVRARLGWARFPYFQTAPAPDGTVVTFSDLRFGGRVGQVTVRVPD
jgi:inner membrane protein